MRYFLIAFFLFSSIGGCVDKTGMALTNLDGTYEGTFERDGKISNVILVIAEGRFSGSSDSVQFPAICEGSIELHEEGLIFTDECMWTADFDWSLILNKEWVFEWNKTSLTLVNSKGDKYLLNQQ
jgi:hypothetical protein